MYKKIVQMAIGVFIFTVGMIGLSILADVNTAVAAGMEVVGDDLGSSTASGESEQPPAQDSAAPVSDIAGNYSNNNTEYIVIEDEQIPAGTSVLPESIPDEVIPAGLLPKTGGLSPSIISVAGLMITLVGIVLRKYYK